MKQITRNGTAALAMGLLTLSVASSSFAWGVDVTTKIGSQEAGRDAHKNSYNRTGSHNIKGDGDFSRRIGSQEAGRDSNKNAYNRYGSHNFGGAVSNTVNGEINVGHNVSVGSNNDQSQGGNAGNFQTGARTSGGSADVKYGKDATASDDGSVALHYGRGGSAYSSGARADVTNNAKFAEQKAGVVSGSSNTFGGAQNVNITLGSVNVKAE